MRSAGKTLPALLMLLVCGFHLVWAMNAPLSPYACPAMTYGGALPADVEREVFVAIEAEPYGRVSIPLENLPVLTDEFDLARNLLSRAALERAADHLISRPWQDINRLAQPLSRVTLPPAPPLLVEEWYPDPPEATLIHVTAVEVAVYEVSYDPRNSRLTADRLIWIRKTPDEK